MLPPAKAPLRKSQNPMQRGFTEKASSINTAFIMSEAIAEATDQKTPLYIAMMDASKAFDVVWHTSLFNKLHDQGVQGDLWLLLADMYNGMSSKVKWQGQLSRAITEGQGLKQGGQHSAEQYKGYTNPTLNIYTDNMIGFHMGTVPANIPTCADDLACISRTRTELQTMISIANNEAQKDHYSFGETKTKVHLGLLRTADSKHDITVADRLKCARRKLYSVKGAGMHGLNGLNPVAALQIWNAHIITVMTYGLEVLCLSRKNVDNLETFQRTSLRQLQHLPKSTSKAAIYLLTGAIPLEGIWERKILTLFGNLIRDEETVEFKIIQRQLAMKSSNTNSWTMLVRKTLWKYNLPSPYQLMKSPPTKERWKRTLKGASRVYWADQLKSEAVKQISLKYLNLETCVPGKPHHVWATCTTDTRDVMRACLKAKILVGQYTLQADRYKRKQINSPMCELCYQEPEDIQHFLVTCHKLKEVRKRYLSEIECVIVKATNMYEWENIWNDRKLLAQVIIDCTSTNLPPPINSLVRMIEPITRQCCFALHNTRRCLIEGKEVDQLLNPPPLSPVPSSLQSTTEIAYSYSIAAEEEADANKAVRLKKAGDTQIQIQIQIQ
jgi:hypothetical protein